MLDFFGRSRRRFRSSRYRSRDQTTPLGSQHRPVVLQGLVVLFEVNGRDRQGLLYDLTRALSALNLQIGSAHITTFGETAVDVFYVKDVFGLQITHESKLKQIHADLLDVMTEEVGADDADDPPTDGLDRSAADPAERMPSAE